MFHPSSLSLSFRLRNNALMHTVHVPPQSSVRAIMDLARLMTNPTTVEDDWRLFDAHQSVWLSPDDVVRHYAEPLLFLPRPGGAMTTTHEAELVVVGADGAPLVAARFTEDVRVVEALRVVAATVRQGPLGYGFWTGSTWLLPADSLATMAGTSTLLHYRETPCGSAMLSENCFAFNSLSDCAFDLHDGKLSAWGPGLGKFGYSPSRVAALLEAFDEEEVLAVAAGISHVAAINVDLQVVVAGAGVDKVDLPPQLNGNVVAVACGYHFSVALTDDGRVCAWGSSSAQGQLGVISKVASFRVCVDFFLAHFFFCSLLVLAKLTFPRDASQLDAAMRLALQWASLGRSMHGERKRSVDAPRTHTTI